MNAHSFVAGTPINKPFNTRPALTLDAVRSLAPSVFAVEPHMSRSSRYAYLPTVNMLEKLMADGFEVVGAVQSRTRIEGKAAFTKHMLTLRHRSDKYSITKVGDSVPQVILINSHDGTSSYQLNSALYRLACSNGLMVAESEKTLLRVQHTGNIIDQVLNASYTVIDGSLKALETSQEWNALQLTAGEQQAFAAAAHELRFADAEGKTHTPITPGQLLHARRWEDRGPMATQNGSNAAPDLWRTLNVVQENVIKGGLSAREKPGFDAIRGRQTRGRMVTTRTVNGIDQDVKLNRALWVLAEKMQELKGGSQVA